ncbi:Transcriptional activator of fatty acid utilization, partial [Haplosporangium sp. Z 27]
MSPVSRRSGSKSTLAPSNQHQQNIGAATNSSLTNDGGLNPSTNSNSNNPNLVHLTSTITPNVGSILQSNPTGLVTTLHDKQYSHLSVYPSSSAQSHQTHSSQHTRSTHHNLHIRPSSSHSDYAINSLSSSTHHHNYTLNTGNSHRQRQNKDQIPDHQKIPQKGRKLHNKTKDKAFHNINNNNNDTNRQIHSQNNRRTIRNPTVNMQGSGSNNNFQSNSIGSHNAFVASHSTVPFGQVQDQSNNPIVNPSWSGYHQPPQHHQPVAGAGLFPAPVEPPARVVPPKPLNQNQVHAQTHPWRIKVYNACLACRKKKIKCDGQPTCGRCARLGFECSYIEVPQTPQSKNAKQKTKPSSSSSSSSEVTAAAISSNLTKNITKGHSSTPLNQQQSSSVDAAKENRQQRRSSTKDAASGFFPHSTSRRAKESTTERPSTTSATIVQATPSTTSQLNLRPMTTLVLDRDAVMPDLYHILVNSVTIPNISRHSQSGIQSSSTATGPGGGGVLMGMDQLNLMLASPAITNFTVLNSESTNSDQHQSSFQKDPATTSFLDQTTPVGFVITNKSVIQYLVHVYFECFHGHWMIVDKEKFLAQLKDPEAPPDPLLLVAICAAGAKYSDHEGLCAEPGNLPSIGEQFLTHARILLQDRFDMPSISTLQALLILYWCQVQTGRASLRFMYAGMAIRMAQEMGLNRPVDPKRLKEMDEREIQIRKTIWWSCYQADRWTSAALGKPMVISDVDCLVEYPSSLTESERYHIHSFCRMTDLSKILGKIILHLYTSTNAATCSSAVFSQLDQSLSSWIDTMPLISSSTPSRSEIVFPTPTSLDGSDEASTGRSSSSQSTKVSSRSGSSTTSTLGQNESTQGSPESSTTLKPEASSTGYFALLFHTVRIMLYRPFLHNSALAPVLPFTLQSPQSLCRESAAAISEIAENMVVEQCSYRQLFNSIHISLCAAATVHRFVISSSLAVNQQEKRVESLDSQTVHDEPSTITGVPNATTPSFTLSTLSKTPPRVRSDLYSLTLLLRILQNCCRFSIEKSLLRNIIDAYIPSEHLSPQDLAWARYEINKPFAIAPFSIKVPLQPSSGSQSAVAFNLPSSSPTIVQPQTRQKVVRTASLQHNAIALPPQQQQQEQDGKEVEVEKDERSLSQQSQTRRYQQYLRQQQNEQRQARNQTQSRPLNEISATSAVGQNLSLGAYTPGSPEDPTLHHARYSNRTSSISSPTGYIATVTPGGQTPSVEQQQFQQYQRELDLLQQQHRLQRSELDQHHQQQALQLEQAQIYQQQQQHGQDYIQQNQQNPSMYIQRQGSSSTSGSLYQSDLRSRERSLSSGVLSPKTPYSNLPDHVIARNKRQSGEPSKKNNHAKKKQSSGSQEQVNEQQINTLQREEQLERAESDREHAQHQHQQQQQQQQEIQNYPQTDSYMTDATSPDVDTVAALDRLQRSDGLMRSNSNPSIISHLTGTTDLSGTSGIANLDEFLGIESAGYYSEIPVTNTRDGYGSMDSTTLPLTGPSSAGSQSQTQLPESSNNSDIWFAHQQQQQQQHQPSTAGSNDSSTNNTHGNNSSISNSSDSNSNKNDKSGGSNDSNSSSDKDRSGSLQNTLSSSGNNGNPERFAGGHIMMVSGPANVSSPWFGFDNISPGGFNQLPPLHPPRSVESIAGYHYPYALYAPQQPVPHLHQTPGVPFVGYHTMGRSITYASPHSYVYPGNGNGAIGMFVPVQAPQNTPEFNAA